MSRIVESLYQKYGLDELKKDEKLTEDYYILIPAENRYDEPIDVMKFAKKYGVFKTSDEAMDKMNELAPDRWDAFITYKLEESMKDKGKNMSRIVESLYQKYDLKEDFWNPGKEFTEFTDILRTEFGERDWNNWNQDERNAFAEKVAKRYLEINPNPTSAFFDDLEDNNFHTYYRAFEKLLSGVNESKQIRSRKRKLTEDTKEETVEHMNYILDTVNDWIDTSVDELDSVFSDKDNTLQVSNSDESDTYKLRVDFIPVYTVSSELYGDFYRYTTSKPVAHKDDNEVIKAITRMINKLRKK